MRGRSWKYVWVIMALMAVSLAVGGQQEPVQIQPARVGNLEFPNVDGMVALAGNIYVAGHDGDEAYIVEYNTNLYLQGSGISWEGEPVGIVSDSASGSIYALDYSVVRKLTPNLSLVTKTDAGLNTAAFEKAMKQYGFMRSGFKPYDFTASPQGIDVDSKGDIYTLYFVRGEFFAEPGQTKPFEVIWLQKYTGSLGFVTGEGWILERSAIPEWIPSLDMAVDKTSGDVYVVGAIEDGEKIRCILLKFTSNLTFAWKVNLFGTPSSSVKLTLPKVAADSNRVYAVAFGKLPGGRGTDIIVEVRGNNRELIGGSSWGWLSNAADMSYDITIDTTSSTKDVYVAGTRFFSGALLIKFDNLGNVTWSGIWPGSRSVARAVVSDSRSVYMAGETSNNGFVIKVGRP